jgi:hypothetical protein
MPTIHLIYPHKRINSAPNVIGWKVYDFLSQKYNVKVYDWDKFGIIIPNDGDILIGHPHPNPFTIFNLSYTNIKWGKRIVLTPFNCDLKQNAFLDKYIYTADNYIAITGNYWSSNLSNSYFSHWWPKFSPIDLAVDRLVFPIIKKTFNPVGNRKIVYIGHTGWRKNTKYLEKIAAQNPDFTFYWCGKGKSLNGFIPLGYLNFDEKKSQEIISNMDFSITVGEFDANPTTILESMAWGIIPICTKSSGYDIYDSIINVPLNNIEKVSEILQELSIKSCDELYEIQKKNWDLLELEFNWDIFLSKILNIIEEEKKEILIKINFKKRVFMLINEIKSPDFFLYPINIFRFIRSRFSK